MYGRVLPPDYPPTDLLNWKQQGDNAVIKREIREFQAQKMIDKLKEFNVPCELKIRPGGGHGFWNDMNNYVILFADWFDKYLK